MRRIFEVLDGVNSHFIYWGCSTYLCGNIFKKNVSIFEAYNYTIINCKDCKKVYEFYTQEELNKSLRKIFKVKEKEKEKDTTVKEHNASEQTGEIGIPIQGYNEITKKLFAAIQEESLQNTNKSLRKVFKINEPDPINGSIIETSSFDLTTEEISSILKKLIDCHNNVARSVGLLKDQLTLKKTKS